MVVDHIPVAQQLFSQVPRFLSFKTWFDLCVVSNQKLHKLPKIYCDHKLRNQWIHNPLLALRNLNYLFIDEERQTERHMELVHLDTKWKGCSLKRKKKENTTRKEKNAKSHSPIGKHNKPKSWVVNEEEDVDVVHCHHPHKNTKSESLLWQQSRAESLKSQRYCLSKASIRAVLSEVMLDKKACGSLTQLKPFGCRGTALATPYQTQRRFSVGDNDRIHLRWPCCEQLQGNGLCCF